LRIQHDDPIRLGPSVIASVPNKPIAYRLRTLLAAVVRDVDPAAACATALRKVDEALLVQALRVWRSAAELALIESQQTCLIGRSRSAEESIDVSEERARRVVVTIIDVGRRGRGTSAAIIVGDHRVPRIHVVHVRDFRRVTLVVGAQCFHYSRTHRIVAASREQPDLCSVQIGSCIDLAGTRQEFGLRGQYVHTGQRSPGAGLHTVVYRCPGTALGAVVRSSGQHSCPLHQGRVSNVQLDCHIPTGGDSRRGRLGQIGRNRG